MVISVIESGLCPFIVNVIGRLNTQNVGPFQRHFVYVVFGNNIVVFVIMIFSVLCMACANESTTTCAFMISCLAART